ncbi:hypothetical protein REPUB_Repub20aG0043100 [Reevesia pubescens]
MMNASSSVIGELPGERNSPAKQLRQILEFPGVHQGPACFDGLSAKLIERAGFPYCFTSGFSISAARLGLPDTGFISYGEMVDQGQEITQAVSIPVIGDGDNGYGNAMNVKRTVKGFIRAGFAGIIIEDQVSPKACGHTQGRKVVSREEAVMKIKAAVDARKESGSDIVIVARTDSRQALSLEESLWRSRAFANAGADVLFIDALASKEEMKSFCEVSPLVPKMANMLEGGGKTPILTPVELEEIGYKLVVYPLSLIGVSIRAMQDSLSALKGGRIPPPGSMPSFEEIKEIVGFNKYYEEEKRYDTITNQLYSDKGVHFNYLYTWAVAYLVSMSIDFVYIKHVVMTIGLNTWGLVLYNNLEALLLFPLELLIMGELKKIKHKISDESDWYSFQVILPVGFSCLFGLAISFFGFSCRRAISATGFTVLGGVMYQQSTSNKPKAVKEATIKEREEEQQKLHEMRSNTEGNNTKKEVIEIEEEK